MKVPKGESVQLHNFGEECVQVLEALFLHVALASCPQLVIVHHRQIYPREKVRQDALE
jgi:hypothetical protein